MGGRFFVGIIEGGWLNREFGDSVEDLEREKVLIMGEVNSY